MRPWRKEGGGKGESDGTHTLADDGKENKRKKGGERAGEREAEGEGEGEGGWGVTSRPVPMSVPVDGEEKVPKKEDREDTKRVFLM